MNKSSISEMEAELRTLVAMEVAMPVKDLMTQKRELLPSGKESGAGRAHSQPDVVTQDPFEGKPMAVKRDKDAPETSVPMPGVTMESGANSAGVVLTNVQMMDHGNGMVTLGIPAEVDEACRVVHQTFLESHDLTYWQLQVLQIFGTRHILIFSLAPGSEESPNYGIADSQVLTGRIQEMLTNHHEQWKVGRQPTLGMAG